MENQEYKYCTTGEGCECCHSSNPESHSLLSRKCRRASNDLNDFEMMSFVKYGDDNNIENTTSVHVPKYFKKALSMMYMMRVHNLLTDVILEVDSEVFYAHKIILAAASPYFEAMLTREMREFKMTRIKLDGLCSKAMAGIITFMYSGQLRITKNSVCALLMTATMLRVDSVVEACCTFLKSQLKPINAINMANFAEKHGYRKLKIKINQYILQHLSQISQQDGFFELPVTQLISLMRRDKLNVEEERQVNNAVVKWIEDNKRVRRADMDNVLELIRCQLMKLNFRKEESRNIDILKELPATNQYFMRMFKDLAINLTPIQEITRPSARLIYIAGGFCRIFLDYLEAFDIDEKVWFRCASMIVPRSGMGSVFSKGKLYIVGGRNNNVPGARNDCNWIDVYNPLLNMWKPCSPMKMLRNRLGVGIIGNLIYAVGGSEGPECLNSVEFYDIQEDFCFESRPMDLKRLGLSVISVNGLIYVIGGYDGVNRLNSVECYQPGNNKWLLLSPMNNRRSGAAVASLVNRYIYAAGGFDGKEHLATAERYDIERDVWEPVKNMLKARSALSLTEVGGKLYAMGGFDGTSILDIVEVYDPIENHWEFGVPMLSARSGHTSAVSRS